MKKLVNSLSGGFFIKALFLISFSLVFKQLSFGQNFSSLIGDAASNSFSKIKPYTSGNTTNMYACGSRTINGTTNATFSKISPSGPIMWSITLNIPSSAWDFEQIEKTQTNEFFLVGRTEPSNPGDDNKSFIVKITENAGGTAATVGAVSLYDQNGREVFSEIIKKNVSGSWNYYVSGIFINGSITGTDDHGAVHVFNSSGVLVNRWRYTDLAAFDSESSAGLINWGSEILVHGNRRGNDGNNFGHFFTINPTTGVISASKRLPNNVYILDAYRGTNGDLYISGNILGTSNSYISRLDGSTFVPKWGHILTGDNVLYDISEDISGNLYAISQNAGSNYWINKIQDNGTSATLLSSRRILETGSTDNSFSSGHLYVNPSANVAYYTDSRLKAGTGTTGFGQTDIILLKQGLNFESFSCNTTTQKLFPLEQGIIENLPVDFTVLQAAPLTTAQGSPLAYERKSYCEQPCIDITQTKIECGKINAAGQQTYTVSGLISNGNATALPVIVTSTSGTIATFSPNPVAAGATNVPFSFTYTPTSVNNNPCFVVQYISADGNVLCKKDFCLPLPTSCCLDLTYTLKCNPSITPNTPQPYVYMVMISNPTTSTINIPMTSSTGLISPSSINAAPGSSTYNVYYTPNAGTTQACIKFGTGIVPLPIPFCQSPKECIPLPNCCLDADGKLSCDSIVNGVRTYKFTGSVTNFGATTALVSGLGITSNVAGAISVFTPASGVPANSSASISFIFTPTGIMPPNICFYFAPSKTTKTCDSVCVQVPNCPPVVSKPCIDVTKLEAKCEKINGVNTIILTGMLNTSTGVVTNLNINPLSAGTISGITGGSIPANATGHNFSFQFVPSANATTYCFVFSPTHPVIDFKLCKDTFCIKNPCPPVVVNDCCPKTSIKPCVCTDSPSFITYNFTSVISAPVCKVEISTAPAVSFLPSNVTVNMVNDGAFVANVHNFISGGVTGNVSFSAAVLIGTSTTFTVTYTLCNGTVCKESFNVKPKTVGDVVLVDNVVLTDTMFAYPIKFRTNNGQSNERVKFISVLLESNSKNKDLLFAINGTAHFGDKNNSIVPLWEAIQGSRSATFELANEVALKDMNNGVRINLVTLGRVTGIRYTLYDAEGALLFEGKIAKLTPTTILSAKETNGSIKINVAPNPASNEAKVSYSTSTDQTIKVELLDISGRIVKTIDQGSRSANQLQTVEFNVSDIENGLYFIRFRNEKGESFVEKLSVIH